MIYVSIGGLLIGGGIALFSFTIGRMTAPNTSKVREVANDTDYNLVVELDEYGVLTISE